MDSAEFVMTEDEETAKTIQLATRTGRPFGSDSFVEHAGIPSTAFESQKTGASFQNKWGVSPIRSDTGSPTAAWDASEQLT